MAKFPALYKIKKAQQKLNCDNTINVSILRNFTLEPFESYLSYLGIKNNCKINVSYSEFDNIFQSIVEASLFNDADIAFYFFSLEHALRGFPYKYLFLSEQEVNELENELADEIIRNINAFREKTNIPLILFLPASPSIYPSIILGQPINKLNIASRLRVRLTSALTHIPNLYFEDMAQLVLRFGEEQAIEKERRLTTSSLYTLDGLGALAIQCFRYIRTITGGTKKVVVLDCDNTLWGGVIGEDGNAGICLSDEGKGKAYKALQYYFKFLSQQGVLVCIASKNNEGDVLDVFDKHADMVLTRKNISSWKINWNTKPDNIRELAKDLKLGLDSFVFVDDSDYELGLVRQLIPEISCVKCPLDYPLAAVEEIIEQGYFDTFGVTNEDLERVNLYQSELARASKRETIVDLDEYLKELDIELFISAKAEQVLSRLSQLTLRTNQFNLTTQRYNIQTFQELLSNPSNLTLHLSASDKYGSLGIVAMASVTISGKNANLNLFLMSCRAIGRKFETVLLESIIAKLLIMGVTYLEAKYIATNKNYVVANFYDEHQFEILEESVSEKKYIMNIEHYISSGAQNLFKISTDF